MKKTAQLCFMLVIWVCAATSISSAQSTDNDNNGNISGLVFSDYYWMAGHHDEDVEGNNGFWIRRVYFTYDRDISDAFSARFRLEAASAGDFISDPKLNTVVKDLYLRWQNDRHQVLAGISPTPTWGLVEDVWGYRSIEKSPLDLMGFGSSRDFGISVKGQLDDTGDLNYHFMFGNGNSNKPEINLGKKAMLSLSYNLTEQLVVEVYGDWNDNPGSTDWITLQGFFGYRSDDLNLGMLFAHQTRNNAEPVTGDDLNLSLLSAFARFSVAERTDGFIRVDHGFDPMPGVNSNDYIPIYNFSEPTILIAGVDYRIESNIHLMPNIEAVFYEEDLIGNDPGTDLIPRLTLFYRF